MTQFPNFLVLTLMAIIAVCAAPAPQDYALQSQAEQLYYLRTYAPKEPWHGRWLVALPSTQQLGLENFTIHPPTAPVRFHPIRLTNGTYALRGESTGDDLAKTPYLTALKSEAGTRTVSIAILYIPSPMRGSFTSNPEACPDGYECIADQWEMDDAGKDGMYSDFRFAGFKGKWEPFKDAAPEGWHVYWKGNAGLHHPVQFDLVPFAGKENGVLDEVECEDED